MSPSALAHIFDSFSYLWVEICLLGGIISILCIDLLPLAPHTRQRYAYVSSLGVGVAAFFAWSTYQAPLSASFFFGHFSLAQGTLYLKLLLLSAYMCSLLGFRHFKKTATPLQLLFFLSLVLGSLCMSMAHSTLAIYLSIELTSVSTYILCALGKQKPYAIALKYLLFGVVSSGLMLYGFSLLYALTGTLSLPTALPTESPLLLLIGILLLAGLCFKIAAFPMHLWVPDIYHSMPPAVLAYLSTGVKAAGWLLLWRCMGTFSASPFYAGLIGGIALLSLSMGNLAALRQSGLRGLLAHSSIAYGGFFLLPLVLRSPAAFQAALFFFTLYLAAQYLAFLFVEWAEEKGMTHMKDYRQLSPYERWHLGIPLSLSMLALIGLPPTAGFIGKWMILSALWQGFSAYPLYGWLLFLLMVLANITWSIFFYLKPLYPIFVKKYQPSTSPTMTLSPTAHILSKSLAFLLLALFFFPQKVLELILHFSF